MSLIQPFGVARWGNVTGKFDELVVVLDEELLKRTGGAGGGFSSYINDDDEDILDLFYVKKIIRLDQHTTFFGNKIIKQKLQRKARQIT